MNINEIPNDKSALENITHELCYVKDNNGNYQTALSSGWEVKNKALENAWAEVNNRIEYAKKAVINQEKSPIYYFMEKNIMDISVLSDYVGFCRFRVRRHFKPSVFKNLSYKTLYKYATVFGITIEELKNLEYNAK
ncbi:MAG: hypothetical protein A2X12_01765 [Bacteroidetes bacterium GWE2_29_8]|nr:MAG: hypothetical protein A2X12_01765 [Bacteroidetes bacterium GWE2_29_8]OFY17896.1 MAG: hypothetical protein A2X02_00515 [Bacteroidetes bacterium GWF2_29_10]